VDQADPHPGESEAEVSIGMVGKYVDLTESYKSLTEALRHAGIHTESRVNIEYIDSEEIETTGCASPGQVRRHPGAGRLRQARRGRQDHGRALSPAKTRSLTWASAWACRSR
jgi:hypothetical protein